MAPAELRKGDIMTHKLVWETPEDRDDVLELLGKAFPEPPEFFADIMSKDPWYGYCRRRLLKSDGQIVSNVDLFTRRVWIGGGSVLLGDLGNVSTHPDHRRKGYCSAIVNDLVSYMNNNGYGFSTLYGGAPEFYGSLGWQLFPEKRAIIKPKEKIKTASGYEVREVKNIADLPGIVMLYHRCRNLKTGATVRSSAYWHKHFDWLVNPPNQFVTVHRDGEAIGFGRYSLAGEMASIKEVGYVEGLASFVEVFMQILGHICSDGNSTINMGYFTAEHPLASLDREDMELIVCDNPTLRMRLINVRSLFSNILPSLRMRLKAGAIAQYKACITIGCESGEATLDIGQNDLDILDSATGAIHLFFGQIDLIRLVLGHASIRDIEFEGSEKLGQEDIDILNILFPEHRSLCWQSDHF